jgi:N6-adenosine-specific RNA methylase IME4
VIQIPRAQVLLTDPAWRYRSIGPVVGEVEQQYDTIPFEEIAQLPVRDWRLPDSVIFCWCTWPKLNEGMELLKHWDYEYVTAFPWIKTVRGNVEVRSSGIGFWSLSVSEVMLIGRTGNPKRKDGADIVLGLLCGSERQFYAPGGAPKMHSRKPSLHEWIEAQFAGPFTELFARRERPGWATIGGDLGFRMTPQGIEKCEPKWKHPRLEL